MLWIVLEIEEVISFFRFTWSSADGIYYAKNTAGMLWSNIKDIDSGPEIVKTFGK